MPEHCYDDIFCKCGDTNETHTRLPMSIFVADILAKTLLVDIMDVCVLMTAFKRIKIAAPYS